MKIGWTGKRAEGGEDREESRLLARARRGDERAFEAIVLRYRDRVHRTAYRIVHSPDDAADVAQETFIKVWRSLPTVRGDLTFATWIYRIAVNTALDKVRQKKRAPSEDLDSPDVKVVSFQSFRGGAREAARGSELQDKVERALEALPARQKAVFTLRHFEGLKLREIGDILECPLGTVKATLHHAVMNLRVALVEAGVVDEPISRTGEAGRAPAARNPRGPEDATAQAPGAGER